eukprot:TRINITY_DN4425_c0_g5_i1.p1 TRINITY_DN4425_c0_g5~~TRINITY_DN4425_c0_g5_i1.p1  ORF type:complete len:878 (+),score=245.04 TRINITY_DN4425_c0_g5_i1:43-2676(+)
MPLPYGQRREHDAFPMRDDHPALLAPGGNAREYRSRSAAYGDARPRAAARDKERSQSAAGAQEGAVHRGRRAVANARPQPMRVFLRVRPYLDAEAAALEAGGYDATRSSVEKTQEGEVWVMDERCLAVKPSINLRTKRTYAADAFDEVLWSFSEDAERVWDDDIAHEYKNQAQVFRAVNAYGDTSLVNMVYEGYSQAVVTYGVMNAGKTHTMFGDARDPGLVTRFLEKISSKATRTEQKFRDEHLAVTLEVSAIRVWREAIEDLLAAPRDAGEQKAGQLRGITDLDALTQANFTSLADLHALVARLHRLRKPSAKAELTKDNRSHVIVTVTVTQKSTFESPDDAAKRVHSARKSTLTLVDLGGGGKNEQESAQDGRLISLAPNAVNRVLACLASRSAVPHRDSVLTQLLQDPLGGNCGTTFIGCVGPYFKQQHDTHLTVEALRKLRSVISMVAPPDTTELEDLRSLHQAKNSVLKHIVTENSNVQKVKDALSSLQKQVNKRVEEHRRVARLVSEEQARHDDLAAAAARTGAALRDVKRYRRQLMPAYDATIKRHKAAKTEAKRSFASLRAELDASTAMLERRIKLEDLNRRLDIAAEVLIGCAVPNDESLGPLPEDAVDAALTETEDMLGRLETVLLNRTSYEEDERLAGEIQRCVEGSVDAARRTKVVVDKTQTTRAACAAELRKWQDDLGARLGHGEAAAPEDMDAEAVEDASKRVSVLAEEACGRRAVEAAREAYMGQLPRRWQRAYQLAALAGEIERDVRQCEALEREAVAAEGANERLEEDLNSLQERAAREEGALEARKLEYEEEMKSLRRREDEVREDRRRAMEIEEAKAKREAELELARLKTQAELAAAEQQRLALEAQKAKGGCCVVS